MPENTFHHYKITYHRRGGDFDLSNSDNKIIATLKHEDSRFSLALIQGAALEIIARNLLGSQYDIDEDGRRLGNLKFNIFRENGVISLLQNDRFYRLKPRGFLKNGYMLLDENANVILELREPFSWNRLECLVTIINYPSTALSIEKLLIICGFVADVTISARNSTD